MHELAKLTGGSTCVCLVSLNDMIMIRYLYVGLDMTVMSYLVSVLLVSSIKKFDIEENMDEHTQFAMRYHQKLTINANSFVCKQCRRQNNGYECHFNLFKKYKNSYFVITSRSRASFIVPRNPIVSLTFCTCLSLKMSLLHFQTFLWYPSVYISTSFLNIIQTKALLRIIASNLLSKVYFSYELFYEIQAIHTSWTVHNQTKRFGKTISSEKIFLQVFFLFAYV